MARRGLFSKIQPPPGAVQADLAGRLQDNVTQAVDQLTADDDLIRSPVVRLTASGAIPAGAAVVVYAGGASRILTLPPANAQGPNVGAVLFLFNASTSSVTVARVSADKVAGGASITVAAGALCVLVSDGVSMWGKAP